MKSSVYLDLEAKRKEEEHANKEVSQGKKSLPKDYIPYFVSPGEPTNVCKGGSSTGANSLVSKSETPFATQADQRRTLEMQKPTLWLVTIKAGNAETQTTAMTMKTKRKGCDDIFK